MSTCPATPSTPTSDAFVNIAAYLFAPLERLPERRKALRALCK